MTTEDRTEDRIRLCSVMDWKRTSEEERPS